MSAGTAVAAIKGRIIHAFGNANAFNEARALSIQELGLHRNSGLFKIMVQRGEIIETTDSKYYMDKAFYDAHISRVKIVLPVALALLLGTAVCAIIWAVLSSR